MHHQLFFPSVFNTIKLTFTQRDHKSIVRRLFPKHLEVQSGKLCILITAFLLQEVLLQRCPSSLEIPAVIYPVCRVLHHLLKESVFFLTLSAIYSAAEWFFLTITSEYRPFYFPCS